MMNCQTLGEAFEKSGRYQRIIGNMIDAHMQFGLGKVRVVYFTPPHAPQMSRHCFEATFSSSVHLANPSLLAHFEQYARDFLAQMDRNDATTQAVTKIILARLDDESLSISYPYQAAQNFGEPD